LSITKDAWDRLQLELQRSREEAEASLHETLAAFIRGNYAEALSHLESARERLLRLDEESRKIY
jgi:hypothetical protein